MVKCTFCGEIMNIGTGKMFVLKEGKVLYYCSSKCEKNDQKLGRKAVNLKWTSKYKKGKK